MTKQPITLAAFKEATKGNQGLRLLTPGNPKTEKGKGAGFWTFILHLAPASLSGWNVCPMATLGCKAACLNTAGRGGIMGGHGILTAADVANGIRNQIQHARIRRTSLFFSDRAGFMALLVSEIEKACKLAARKGYKPVFRLNGTSDIRWETIGATREMTDAFGTRLSHRLKAFPNVFAAFPDVQFYDYTKIANRKNLPANYALTFSLADGNDAQARAALANGVNVAAVFRNKSVVAQAQADGFLGFPVANGDETDLRFLDPAGHVIALYAKGNAKGDQSGFVRD
jgi:hypothetical protein